MRKESSLVVLIAEELVHPAGRGGADGPAGGGGGGFRASQVPQLGKVEVSRRAGAGAGEQCRYLAEKESLVTPVHAVVLAVAPPVGGDAVPVVAPEPVGALTPAGAGVQVQVKGFRCR